LSKPERIDKYLVSAVRYDEQNSHIDKVLEHYDDAGLGSGTEATRASLLWRIQEDKAQYATVHFAGSEPRVGAKIGIVTVDGARYLRIDGERLAADDLGSLPQF
jgi:hypothetical protein